MNPKHALVLALSLAVPAGACGESTGAPRTSTTLHDSAGIAIASSTGEDIPLLPGPTHQNDLGSMGGTLAGTPWGIAADSETGRIYAASDDGDRVGIYGRSGEWIGSFGRSGSGPGEFENPSALHVNDDGVLTVWDTGRGVLSRWSAEGQFLGERAPGVSYWGPGFTADSLQIMTVSAEQMPSQMQLNQQLVRYRPDGESVIHEVPVELGMLTLPCISRPAQRLFAPFVIWTASGDKIYVLKGPEYRIDIYEDTVLVSSIRRDIDPIATSNDMAIRALESGRTPYGRLMRMCGVTPEELVRAVGIEDAVSVVQQIAVDPGGRIWVTRTEDGISPSKIDLFRADGSYLGTFSAPGMVVGFPSPTSFLSLSLNAETGVSSIALHELTLDTATPE